MLVKGWVYIITNMAMPDLVKVGFSMKDPVLRASELGHTGNPHPYEVRYECLVFSPRDVEQRAHSRLSRFREGKEWFRCDLDVAIAQIREAVSGNILVENNVPRGEAEAKSLRARIDALEREFEGLETYYESPEYKYIEAHDEADTEWRQCVARYSGLPEKILREFYEEDSRCELAESFAANPATPSELLEELILVEPRPEVLRAALNNPSSTSKVLAAIAWLSDFELLSEAEKHSNYSEHALHEVLLENADDESSDIRALIAECIKCQPYLLERLAGDNNHFVRLSVAKNPSTSATVLYRLGGDLSEEIRVAATNHPHHPCRLLSTLKSPSDVTAFLHIYSESSVLAMEFRAQVKETLHAGLLVPELILLASHPDTPSDVLGILCKHPDYLVRQEVALHTKTPADAMNALAEDREIKVRIAAKHKLRK